MRRRNSPHFCVFDVLKLFLILLIPSPIWAITSASESSPIRPGQAENPANIHLTFALKSREAALHDIALQSGWEAFLLAAPFVGMVLVGVFRLDEIATNSSLGQRSQFNGLSFDGPSSNGHDDNGRMLLTDLDGRPAFDSHSPEVTTSVN